MSGHESEQTAALSIRDRGDIIGTKGPISGDEWKALAEIGKIVQGTDFVPKSLRTSPPAIMACLLYGREQGLGPMMSLQNISVIDGKPSMSAALMTAKIRESGNKIERIEHRDDKGTIQGVTARGTRRDGTVDEFTFTLEMAARAGLLAKEGGGWKKYPEAMLWARAVSQLARMLFADVFLGPAYTPEELGAEVDEEGAVVEVPAREVVTEPEAESDAVDWAGGDGAFQPGGPAPASDQQVAGDDTDLDEPGEEQPGEPEPEPGPEPIDPLVLQEKLAGDHELTEREFAAAQALGWLGEAQEAKPEPVAEATAAEAAPEAPEPGEAPRAGNDDPDAWKADYDELPANVIRARLPSLNERQLKLIRSHEAATKDRSSILKQIDKQLGVTSRAPAVPLAPRPEDAEVDPARAGAIERLSAACRLLSSGQVDGIDADSNWALENILGTAAKVWNPEIKSLHDLDDTQLAKIWDAVPEQAKHKIVTLPGEQVAELAEQT